MSASEVNIAQLLLETFRINTVTYITAVIETSILLFVPRKNELSDSQKMFNNRNALKFIPPMYTCLGLIMHNTSRSIYRIACTSSQLFRT